MNSSLPRIEIETSGISGKIRVNGTEVPGVRRYALVHEAGKVPMLKLDLMAVDITVDGKQVLPCLPDVFKSYYEPKELDATAVDSFGEVCRENAHFSGANPATF